MRAFVAMLLALSACAAEPSSSPTASVPTISVPMPAHCRQWAPFLDAAKSRGIELIEVLPAAGFVTAFNAIPPKSDFSAERVWVARLREDEARVFFVTGGCLTGVAASPWEDVARSMGQES